MQTKSEMINRIAELANEVEQWKHEYKVLDACLELAQGKIAELKAENECLKQEFEIESLTDKTTGETIYRSNSVNKLKELLKVRIENLCESCGASSMMPMPCTVYKQTLQEIKAIAEPFAKCYTHTCRNCEKYDSAHACCLKDINCYKYNDGSASSCKDFVLPTKQFYQQILANVITKITKAEEE